MPEKDHKETLDSARQKLSEIIDQSETVSQEESFMSPEQIKEELDNELDLLLQETAALETRRQELIYKDNLTDAEREAKQKLKTHNLLMGMRQLLTMALGLLEDYMDLDRSIIPKHRR